jgi:hypothetical protein
MYLVHKKEETIKDTDTQRKDGQIVMEMAPQGLKLHSYKSKKTKDYQPPTEAKKEAQNGFSLYFSKKDPTLPTP